MYFLRARHDHIAPCGMIKVFELKKKKKELKTTGMKVIFVHASAICTFAFEFFYYLSAFEKVSPIRLKYFTNLHPL